MDKQCKTPDTPNIRRLVSYTAYRPRETQKPWGGVLIPVMIFCSHHGTPIQLCHTREERITSLSGRVDRAIVAQSDFYLPLCQITTTDIRHELKRKAMNAPGHFIGN